MSGNTSDAYNPFGYSSFYKDVGLAVQGAYVTAMTGKEVRSYLAVIGAELEADFGEHAAAAHAHIRVLLHEHDPARLAVFDGKADDEDGHVYDLSIAFKLITEVFAGYAHQQRKHDALFEKLCYAYLLLPHPDEASK